MNEHQSQHDHRGLSGPLIGLACIGQLDLVKALARRVVVPPAVHLEVTI